MLWVVQNNLDNENKRSALFEALERLGIDYLAVDVHHNTITPDIDDDRQAIITNGSIMLSDIAHHRGWSPGSFLNENYDYSVWSHYYRGLLLNKDAIVSTIEDAKFIGDNMFIRPVLDNKTFNGKVFNRDEFKELQKSCSPKTEVLLSTPKKIGQEHRHYIVDGEIITSSRYKLAGQPNFRNGCDDNVLEVVKKAIDIWTPARAFVLDTYIAGEEIGIVEIGSICHAGLYDVDILKLVNALDSMPIKDKKNNYKNF